jgi:hypothetical protein
MEKKHSHVMYGFITAIAMIVVNVILYVTGLAFKSGMQYVSDIPFLIGIIMNAMAFSKSNDSDVTFGKVFGNCFKACALITLITLAWCVLSLWIFPEMKTKVMEMTQESMLKQNMSDAQIETAMEMTRKYFNVFMIGGVIFGTMFAGVIFSLIGAAVAKKKPAVLMQ